MASADNDVIGMRIGEIDFEGSQALRLVVETDEPLDAKLLLLHDPWRLVIDSVGLSWNVPGLESSGNYPVARPQLTGLAILK